MRPLRPVRTPPAHPSAARARGLPRMSEHPPCKTLPRDAEAPPASRTPRIPRLPRARRYPGTPRLPPVPTGRRDAGDAEAPPGSTCKPVTEDPGAPTGKTLPGDAAAPPGVHRQAGHRGPRGSDRWPWPPYRDLGRRGRQDALGVLGDVRRPWSRWGPWTPWTPWTPRGSTETSESSRHRQGPWGASGTLETLGSTGALGSVGGLGIYNCKNGFWSVLENHRFLKKSRKSYQNFRNNSKSQTMKSAQELFYRFWDRAIMTQSITAVFANRGGASAQYRTKKVSHN